MTNDESEGDEDEGSYSKAGSSLKDVGEWRDGRRSLDDGCREEVLRCVSRRRQGVEEDDVVTCVVWII